MKFGQATLALAGAASAVHLSSRSTMQTQVMGLEAPNLMPSTNNFVGVEGHSEKFSR